MNRTLCIAALAAIAAVTLTGCGGGSSTDFREELGCVGVRAQPPPDELFERAEYVCVRSDGPDIIVKTFASEDAKQHWVDFAEMVGVVVNSEGDTWVVTEP